MVLVFLTGCSVSVRGRQRPLLTHRPITGELELVGEKRTDEQGTSSNKRKSKTTVFEERVRLKTKGDLYHPNFLLFDAAAGLGLAQQSLSSDEESGRTSSSLTEYYLSGQLLRVKPYPLSFHMSKSEDLIARQFLGSLQTETKNAGVSLAWRSKDWPMRFQYSDSKSKQDSLESTATDFFRRDSEQFAYSLRHNFSELSRMSFELGRNDVSQRSLGASTDIKEERYTLLHDLIFGSKEQHRLDSFLSILDQSGTVSFENSQWQERLRLQHSSNFLTNYSFRFIDSKRERSSNQQVHGLVGFQHRLYESLVTTGSVFGSETEFDQGQLEQQGGTLSFSYRKKNPWGVLLSTYSASPTWSVQSGGSGTGIVTDESHVFTDPVPITLDRVNIDTSTIVVTDSTGLNVYTLGDDYTITEISGRVRVNATTLGTVPPDISDGQELLVDYTFFVEPKRKEDKLRQNFTLRERFRNGLSLYYAHQRQDERVSSTITGITPDEFRTNTFGAEYVRKGLSLLAEYSKEESTQLPSTSKRLEAQYSWRVNKDTMASLQASNQLLDFGEPDPRDVRLFRSGAELFSRLTNRHSVSARLDYRDEDDSKFGKTEGFQLNSELLYNNRQLSVTAGAEFNLLNRRKDEINSTFLYIRVKRRF
jgi:hypothetical protein